MERSPSDLSHLDLSPNTRYPQPRPGFRSSAFGRITSTTTLLRRGDLPQSLPAVRATAETRSSTSAMARSYCVDFILYKMQPGLSKTTKIEGTNVFDFSAFRLVLQTRLCWCVHQTNLRTWVGAFISFEMSAASSG